MNDTISLGLGITAAVWDSPERSSDFVPGLRGIRGAGSAACDPVRCTPWQFLWTCLSPFSRWRLLLPQQDLVPMAES